MAGAVEAVKRVVQGERDSAFLYGPPGLGKTHLAWAAIHAALEAGWRAVLWEVPELLTYLRSLVGQEPERANTTVEQVVESHSKAGVLVVLDDLGAHNPTGWAEEQLYMILNGRYKNEAPTIITANVGMERIDPRIRSRFRSGIVICEGEDQRGRSSEPA